MKKRLFIALILILMLVPLSIAAKPENNKLIYDTSYVWACDGSPDPTGGTRTHSWTGFVYQDGVEIGTINWWMYLLEMRAGGNVSHWADAYWEINIAGDMITGYESGTTRTNNNPNRLTHAIWRANGFVETGEGIFANQDGSKIQDGGNVTFGGADPCDGAGNPLWSGTGQIRINK